MQTTKVVAVSLSHDTVKLLEIVQARMTQGRPRKPSISSIVEDAILARYKAAPEVTK